MTQAEKTHPPLVFSFSSDDPQREFLTSVGESRTSFLECLCNALPLVLDMVFDEEVPKYLLTINSNLCHSIWEAKIRGNNSVHEFSKN